MHDPVRVLIRGVLLLGLAALHFSAAGADTVRVCVEEANALPDEHGNPIGTQVLREVEKISDLRFVFTQAPYSRCLFGLRNGNTDLVLHVPYLAEPGFESYGLFLNWTVPVKADLVSLDPAWFAKLDTLGDGRIGVPRGNLEFAASATGIAPRKFQEITTMKSLVKMLTLGRIDMVWYDRVSVRQELAAQNVQNAYYYELPIFGKVGSIGVGLAKTPRGEALKRRLDALIPQVDVKALLAPRHRYLQPDLPQAGPIKLPFSRPTRAAAN